jgi:hypothetical protein
MAFPAQERKTTRMAGDDGSKGLWGRDLISLNTDRGGTLQASSFGEIRRFLHPILVWQV